MESTRFPTSRWFFADSCLLLIVHEAHELAHVLAGKWLCDEWASSRLAAR